MKNVAARAQRVFVTTCEDGHVVLVFRDGNGADVAQAHLTTLAALNIAADIQQQLMALLTASEHAIAGHA